LAFFPYEEGGIEYAAPQTLTRSQDAVELAMKVGYQPPQGGTVRGVLLATEQSGNDTVTVPMEISATLSGAGGVVEAGPGPLIVTGSESYTGGTTIEAGGIVQLGTGGAGGSITGNIIDGGVLIVDESGTVTLSSGVATCAVTYQSVGSHAITAPM